MSDKKEQEDGEYKISLAVVAQEKVSPSSTGGREGLKESTLVWGDEYAASAPRLSPNVALFSDGCFLYLAYEVPPPLPPADVRAACSPPPFVCNSE
jgi:hypothetical protein